MQGRAVVEHNAALPDWRDDFARSIERRLGRVDIVRLRNVGDGVRDRHTGTPHPYDACIYQIHEMQQP